MRVRKGSYGYVRSQKWIRTGLTVLLFGINAALLLFGMYMNDGSRKNIYTLIAVIGCIPASMIAVSMIMMLRVRPMKEALYREVSTAAGDLTMLYELYLTTREKNLFLDAVAIGGGYVMAYTSEKVPAAHIAEMEEHLRRTVRSAGCTATVKIWQQKDKYLDRIAQMREKEDELTESDLRIRTALLAVAL